MIYEPRIYDVIPGKLRALNDRFASTTVHIFERHGIERHGSKVIGSWTNVIAVSNRITYLVRG